MEYSQATKVRKNDILIYNSEKDGPQEVKVLIIYKYEHSVRFKVANKSNNWVHSAHSNKFSFKNKKQASTGTEDK
jgi:hypothetical protein